MEFSVGVFGTDSGTTGDGSAVTGIGEDSMLDNVESREVDGTEAAAAACVILSRASCNESLADRCTGCGESSTTAAGGRDACSAARLRLSSSHMSHFHCSRCVRPYTRSKDTGQ